MAVAVLACPLGLLGGVLQGCLPQPWQVSRSCVDGVGVGRCRFLRSRAVISFPQKGSEACF